MLRPFRWLTLACCLVLVVAGCDSSDGSAGADAASDPDAASDTAAGTDDTSANVEDATSAEDAVADSAPSDDVPTGPQPAPLEAYSGGTCPEMREGSQPFLSSGETRQVTVFLPPDPAGAGVVFLWHGFGDTAANFANVTGAANVAFLWNLIVVVPVPNKQVDPQIPPTWGLLGDAETDLVLFDDLLACLDGDYGIDPRRVYTMGFSAGALWSSLLTIERAQILAAATLWSGGTSAGGLVTVPYREPSGPISVLASWGGDSDVWPNAQFPFVDFQVGTLDLADNLAADEHVVVRCNHQLGHTIPFGGLNWGWQFLIDHSYGEPSPYADHDGTDFPDYCTFPGAR